MPGINITRLESTLARQFIDFSIRTLQQYAGEIDKCLSKLSQQQVWPRGGTNQNAIGNLVLHLYPFHKYGLVFREDHSPTVVAPNGAAPRGPRQQAVWQYVS
jgi:hypothetical protein